MNQTLEERRAANTADITLESGQEITGTLPRIRDCLIAGDIPLAVLAEMEKRAKNPNPDGPEPTADDLRVVAVFNDNLVMGFVTHMAGKPVELTPDDMALFTDDEYNEIVLYASRAKPLPGKD